MKIGWIFFILETDLEQKYPYLQQGGFLPLMIWRDGSRTIHETRWHAFQAWRYYLLRWSYFVLDLSWFFLGLVSKQTNLDDHSEHKQGEEYDHSHGSLQSKGFRH